jgi:hypothetical protein
MYRLSRTMKLIDYLGSQIVKYSIGYSISQLVNQSVC